MTLFTRLLLTTAFALPVASVANAAMVLGLSGDKTLVMFDTEKPEVASSMDVTGVDKLAGIDFRPATKTVVGVTPDSTLVTIDLDTGAATEVAKMDNPLAMGDTPVIVDFNPMADRLRLMATDGTNHRVNVDDGMVTVDGSLGTDAAAAGTDAR